jgi:hypothetical protein
MRLARELANGHKPEPAAKAALPDPVGGDRAAE